MEEKILDFEELWYLFKKKFWIIILITAISTSLGVYRVSKKVPTYVATTKIFIGKNDNLLTYYSSQEMDYYSQMVSVFSEISRIDGFLDDTLKKKKINKTSLEVASALSFSSSANTPIVNISYRSADDKEIEKILNAVSEELISKVKEVMPGTVPSTLTEATVSTIYPNKYKLPVIGFLAGIILSVGLIFVLDYLDDRILSKKQLEKVIPVPIIGSIPTYEKEFRKESKDVYNKKDTKVVISGSL